MTHKRPNDPHEDLMHLQSNTAYRFAVGLALTAAFLIVWLNAAAGLIGIEDDDPANLLYFGVLAIGFIGAIISRLQPGGLARVLFATAVAQALVAAIAIKLPNTASSAQIVILHGVFVALSAGAALLFRYAARKALAPRGRWLWMMLMATSPSLARGQTGDQHIRREIAVTFDDLPGVAMLLTQRCNPKGIAAMNRKLLRTIGTNRIPALGLVVEGRLCASQRSALPEILNLWLDADLELGNHSFSHFDLNNTPLAAYQADVVRGETVTSALLKQRGKRLRYCRHPFLHAGKDLRTKQAFDKFLIDRGYQIAPVTIDNQEWVFAEVYARASGRGDTVAANRIGAAYLTYMEEVFNFFERLSVEVVGREIKQVLLLHANPLNAEYFDELVQMMRRRGYTFITLDQALQDPAYRLPDTYAGPKGLSWLHRWASTKGMKTREEPREPEFIARLYRSIFRQD